MTTPLIRPYSGGVAPSSDGTAPRQVSVPRNGTFDLDVTLAVDTAGKRATGSRIVTPNSDHVALSVDGTTFGAFGAPATVTVDIGANPAAARNLVMRFRGMDTDPTLAQFNASPSSYPAWALVSGKLVLSLTGLLSIPQTGIVDDASGSLGSAADAGTGTDAASLGASRPLGTAADDGVGTDAATIGKTGAPQSLGTATDAGAGTDSAALGASRPLGSADDSGAGADVASIGKAASLVNLPAGTYYMPLTGTALLSNAPANGNRSAGVAGDVCYIPGAKGAIGSSYTNVSPAANNADATLSPTIVAAGGETSITYVQSGGATQNITLDLPSGYKFAAGANVVFHLAMTNSESGNSEDGYNCAYSWGVGATRCRIVVS